MNYCAFQIKKFKDADHSARIRKAGLHLCYSLAAVMFSHVEVHMSIAKKINTLYWLYFFGYMPCINVFDCIDIFVFVFEDIYIELLQLKLDQGKALGTKGLRCCQDA